ncbi:hypothetical protein HMN09_00813300 [Mycena chlorophos]|uniref:Uncharacterized protein n=1 Tax=Mycena chlorophos TaxID=658473 RepID=A0A8H6SUA2_MYCCL|nr:hypothetical protein HMN09_00813300 [Mycena chlorophos]
MASEMVAACICATYRASGLCTHRRQASTSPPSFLLSPAVFTPSVVAASESEMASLNDQLLELQLASNRQQTEHDAAVAQTENLRVSIESLQERLNNKMLANDALSAQLRETQDLLAASDIAYNELRAKYERAVRVAAGGHNASSALGPCQDRSARRLADAEAEIAQLRLDVHTLEKQVSDHEETCLTMAAELHESRAAMQHAQAHLEGTQHVAGLISDERDALLQEIKMLKEENHRLGERVIERNEWIYGCGQEASHRAQAAAEFRHEGGGVYRTVRRKPKCVANRTARKSAAAGATSGSAFTSSREEEQS